MLGSGAVSTCYLTLRSTQCRIIGQWLGTSVALYDWVPANPEDIPPKVAVNQRCRNAIRHSDKQNARIEHDKVLQGVLVDLISVQIEMFKEYQDNWSFKKWLEETVFAETYVAGGG